MPPLDVRLAEISTALKGLTEAFNAAETARREDHDQLVVLVERMSTACARLDALATDHKEEGKTHWTRVWTAAFSVFSAALGAAAALIVSALKETE